MNKLVLFLSLTLVQFSLWGEIENIRFNWNNVQCKQDCADQLNKNLLKVKELSSVSVNQQTGYADLKWKPNTPFSYRPIQEAYSRVGIPVLSLRLKVKGTITKQGTKFFIISTGDGTRFNLLGTTTPDPHREVIQDSRFNRPISPEIQEQLTQAQKDKLQVTIEGPILEPRQFPPLDLIIETINVSKPKR